MSYIGSTPTTQSFIAGTDYFNGNGSTVNFTLSRSVNSVNDIEVIVNNVEQIPSGYSVSGTTLTFSAAPSAGTSNVYVRYLSTTNLSLAIPAGTSATFNTVTVADGSATTPSITNDGDTNTGIFFPAADTIAFAEGGTEVMRIDSDGDVGIGTSTPAVRLHVSGSSTYVAGVEGSSTFALMGFKASGTTGTIDNANVAIGATGDALYFRAGGAERARIDSSGNVGIGTSSPAVKLDVSGSVGGSGSGFNPGTTAWVSAAFKGTGSYGGGISFVDGSDGATIYAGAQNLIFGNGATSGGTTERARIDSSGNWLVKKTSTDVTVIGAELRQDGQGFFTVTNDTCIQVNRLTGDGNLVNFRQDSTVEGTISVSGTTVSYNGGHLSRWAQTITAKDDTLVKGTVLSNLDEMNVYTDADGNPVDNEQLNKVKVSDVEGDANVAGVFVNWTHDDQHDVDEINMAMTGDMIIRIAQGTTVARGDLLMSAGDGTAKPQGDDIVRSKTVAKVTSTHVTCTYADGSYCVPCVLMAC